jgi:hypothetical protein
MDFKGGHDLVKLSTCTTCQFTEDLSNYWTAVLFYRANNGSFMKVPQVNQQGTNGIKAGMVRQTPPFFLRGSTAKQKG